jgi:ParB family chromosome partitioning protein
MEAQIQMINVGSIIPNRFQPRQEFDQEALNELASSIRIHGIVQPLVVRRVQDKFEIIAGERRYKAAISLGLTAVPCIICALEDNEVAEVAVVENIHRRDLSPIEEAKGYKNILDKKYLTQDQLAERMGIKPTTLSDKLSLLTLDESVQSALQKNQISERHARTLLKLTDKMKQVDLLNEIITNRLTVKQVEDKINQIISGYSVKENVTGGINIDTKNDIDINNTFNTEDEFNLSITPTQYQYQSKINTKSDKKVSFFNELENAPVTMEDPTLSFGFNPLNTQDIEAEEPEIIDLDEEGDELPGFEKPNDELTAEEILRKKFNVDVYTPREFTKAVNDLILIAQDNGLEIKTEEFNFNDVYQMVIKIVKENDEEEEVQQTNPVNEIPDA